MGKSRRRAVAEPGRPASVTPMKKGDARPPRPAIAAATTSSRGTTGATGSTAGVSHPTANPAEELAPVQHQEPQQPAGRARLPPSSGRMRNVRTFLWRTLYIQASRRHRMATGLELGGMVLLFYFSFGGSEHLQPLAPEGVQRPLDVILRPSRPRGLVYGPNSTYNIRLMAAVARELEEIPIETTPATTQSTKRTRRTKATRSTRKRQRRYAAARTIQGTKTHPGPDEDRARPPDGVASSLDDNDLWVDVIRGWRPSVAHQQQASLPVEPVQSADMVITSCRQQMASSDAGSGVPLCVALDSTGEGQGAEAVDLKFTVYQPTPLISIEPREFPLGGRFASVLYARTFRAASAFQYTISKHHLQIQRAAFPGKPDPNVTAEDLPGWVFTSESFYRTELIMAIYVGFLITQVKRMTAIEMEFSTGVAEHQGVMGLSDIAFLLGHFLTIMAYELMAGASLILIIYILPTTDGPAYAQGVSFSLMAVALLLFHVNHAIFIILLSWVFPKGWVGIIIGILLTVAVPNVASFGRIHLSVANYFLLERRFKLLSSILPNTGLAGVLRIMFIARDFEGGAGWSLLIRRVLDRDNVTILEIWTGMVIVDVIMIFLAWYLSKIAPWSTENPQNPFFCLTASYWSTREPEAPEGAITPPDPERFEMSPPNVRPVIEVTNLTKVYGDKPALNGLDLKIWESKVTVLLGHNGAGKTTLMSILTGMKGPTSGVAKVCGLNASKQRDEIRKVVSLCPQSDIFFEDMSCEENLLYFGSLKGCDVEQLQKSIANTLKVVKLEEKTQSLPSTLSGGMKRRLSLAIAIVSNPKILILDEPTTGMDPETRRNVWDVIQTLGKQHTVLLSSHDMEEADALGDYIIVMAQGRAVCSGTTAFLKKACGVGYKISLVKAPRGFNLRGTLAEIRKTAPKAEVEDDKQGEVVIALRTLHNRGFPAMFKALEASKGSLGVASMGVTVASMKDVYLKINMDWAPGGREREEAVEDKDIAGVCASVPKTASTSRRFWALFAKRTLYLARSWGIIILGLVIPLVLQLFTVNAVALPTFAASTSVSTENGTVPIELRLGAHFPGSEVFVQESPASETSRMFRLLVESENSRVHELSDASKDLWALAREDFPHYILSYPMAAVFEQDVERVMPNPTSVVTLPIAVNMLQTAQLRVITNQPAARIQVTLAYLSNDKASVQLQLSILVSVAVWLYWGVMPIFSLALAFAVYAAFPVAERVGGARDVQLMTGMSSSFFVLAHLVFDWLCYMVVMIPWCLIHYAFSNYTFTTAVAYILTFAFFGPSIICLSYLMAERSESVGGAISHMVLLVFVGGFVSVLGFVIMAGVSEMNVQAVYMLFPPFTLIATLSKVSQLSEKAARCQLLKAPSGGRTLLEPTLGHRTGHTMGFQGSLLQSISDSCGTTSPFSFSGDGVFRNFILMLVEGAVLFYLMTKILSGYWKRSHETVPKEEQQEVDEDVEEEKRLVNQLRDSKDFSRHALVAWNLHKCFGPLHAVKGVHLALRPGECFGLLGVNGAGKTTTFQMLAGLTAITEGEAYTAAATLREDLRKWQSQISYCFQLGGLLDRLNAYEYLYLVGRLRGIADKDLKPMVDSIIFVVDLKPHANKECGLYSGGNRRKLSIGAALLGLPPIVFLDEPYAGVDVVSRTKIFKAISLIKQRTNTAVMLTSHNMDECELACDRLTIMVRGHMMCLGTLQHLRNKFGKGYRLEFMLKHEAGADAKQFREAVPVHFPNIKLTDHHENVFSYHLVERIPWSTLFEKVAALEKDFPLEHAMVGDNTLEQIFIAFAKAQEAEGSSGHIV